MKLSAHTAGASAKCRYNLGSAFFPAGHPADLLVTGGRTRVVFGETLWRHLSLSNCENGLPQKRSRSSTIPATHSSGDPPYRGSEKATRVGPPTLNAYRLEKKELLQWPPNLMMRSQDSADVDSAMPSAQRSQQSFYHQWKAAVASAKCPRING